MVEVTSFRGGSGQPGKRPGLVVRVLAGAGDGAGEGLSFGGQPVSTMRITDPRGGRTRSVSASTRYQAL